MQAQLLGQPVNHTSFGKGIITDISGKIVTINFSQGKKKFLYPEAFSNFLTLSDTEKQNEINAKYNKMLEAKESARKKECEEEERIRQLRTMKINPNSQAVFNIAPHKVPDILACGFVSTGCYLSGSSKGEPRIPNRIKPNSACLLTGLPESNQEKDRLILGAFMVKEDFWGERSKNGMVNRHDKYSICLPSHIRLPYWNYFEHGDTLPCWGKVPFKYFANSTMQSILQNMIDLLIGTKQESLVKEFYHYFCEMNRLQIKQRNIGELQ